MSEGVGRVLLCITPAPAIDRTAHVERIIHGDVLRPMQLVALPGGKGVNAARAAARLGGSVMTSGIAGGHAGRWIIEALTAEALNPRWSLAEAESRTTYVTVGDDGDSVLVYERPGLVTDDEYAAFLTMLEGELLPVCGRVVVAGSMPRGVGPGGLADVVAVCRRVGRPVLLDASGPGLEVALAAGPDIVKIGRVEAVDAGVVEAGASTMEAAGALVDRGATLAIVTDGAGEVAAADATTTWRVAPPRIEAVNAVGSGDSFNAAFSLALLDGADIATALSRGVAAGSANALSLGAAMLDPDVASELEHHITVATTKR